MVYLGVFAIAFGLFAYCSLGGYRNMELDMKSEEEEETGDDVVGETGGTEVIRDGPKN